MMTRTKMKPMSSSGFSLEFSFFVEVGGGGDAFVCTTGELLWSLPEILP